MKLLEYQAKEVLAGLGIAIPAGRVARTPEEAARACAELGPVADHFIRDKLAYAAEAEAEKERRSARTRRR